MRPELVIIQEKEAGERLDKWLARRFPDFSRQAWKNRVVKGEITLNGQAVSASKSLAAGDQVLIPAWEKEEVKAPVMESLPLTVLYEDEWFVILDKPAGLVVHPAPGHAAGTLVNAILASYPGLSDLAGQDRPGIVHRLDKDTSGLILIARNNEIHRKLAELFRKSEIERVYEAVVHGRPQVDRGLIDLPIARAHVNRKKMMVREDGKASRTSFEVISSKGDHSHLRCQLLTGRTHQIRVHLAYIGHPVLGDSLYGGRKKAQDPPYQLLHARRLSFTHPMTGKPVDCQSPLPPRFLPYIEEEDSPL
ncbi:MAG: RluA family pseudouridine synthase [Clostridiaceae bacterium]|nr:RluA family pseudouridine synthase [Clostridiaceae bacterium]